MNLADTHGGFAGKSLVEKIREELDEAFAAWADLPCDGCTPGCDDCMRADTALSYAEGIACALGILRSTSQDEEMNLAEERYEP